MKCIPVVILAVVALVAGVTGCDSMRRYDARLAAADSLMHSHPDSALAIVQSVDRDSLASESDRAYRDLLLTQARYRCYITATSDSDINRALAYYRAHSGEREKLTRALIYKGAVMEELGHPDSAMLYYKQAEATADENDYFNLGQINLRIAALYRMHYVDFQKCYNKYEAALKYYRLIGDKTKQLTCIFNMGMCAGITNTTDAMKLLEDALSLATELNDSSCQYECKEIMCRQLSHEKSRLGDAKVLALDCLNNYSKYKNQDLILDLAYIYAEENNADSAMFYINLVDMQQCSDSNLLEQIQYRKNDILTRIAAHDGNLPMYQQASDSATQVSDQIHNGKTKHIIQSIEHQYEQQSLRSKDLYNRTLRITIWISCVLFVTILILFTCFYLRKVKRSEVLIREITENGINAHEDLTRQISDKNSEIAHFVTSLVELIRMEIQDGSVATQKMSLDNQVRTLVKQTINDKFWHELLNLIDQSRNSIITRSSKHAGIKQSDLRFIALACCGFSTAEIAFIMDYSPKYISTKRRSIANKLGLNVPLQSYLDEHSEQSTKNTNYRKQ